MTHRPDIVCTCGARFNGLEWSKSVAVADLLAMPVEETQPGRTVYAIHDDEAVLYIGQTSKRLGARISAHTSNSLERDFALLMRAARKGDRSLKVCWVQHVKGLEARLIGLLRPRFNKLHRCWINVHGSDLPSDTRRAA